MTTQEGKPAAIDGTTLPLICTKCKKPTMKRSNFRTGSVDKPKADVGVCSSCGHRVELDSK